MTDLDAHDNISSERARGNRQRFQRASPVSGNRASKGNYLAEQSPKMRGLKGCTEGNHGPVRIIVQNGAFVEPLIDRLARQLTHDQELAEQDYLGGCPFSAEKTEAA